MKIPCQASDCIGAIAVFAILAGAPLFSVSSSSDYDDQLNSFSRIAQIEVGSRFGAPQEAPDATHAEDVRTIYVSVADQSGTPIDNLGLNDFTITAGGEPQQILNVSSAKAVPLTLGILVDWSGSVRNEPALRDELELLWQFLKAALTTSDRAVVVAFNDDIVCVNEITGDLPKLHAQLSQIAEAGPRGSTALFDSLDQVSSKIAADSNPHKVVLVLSDFEDTASRGSLDKMLQRVVGTGVTVFAAFEGNEYSKKIGWKNARQIAKKSGGFAYSAKASANLAAALNQLVVALRSGYQIEYRATGRGDKHHAVSVKVGVRRAGAVVFAPEYGAAVRP